MKHPVDVHVGKRIRHRRWMVGMTQQQLAETRGHQVPADPEVRDGHEPRSALRGCGTSPRRSACPCPSSSRDWETSLPRANGVDAGRHPGRQGSAGTRAVVLRHPRDAAPAPVRTGSRPQRRRLKARRLIAVIRAPFPAVVDGAGVPRLTGRSRGQRPGMRHRHQMDELLATAHALADAARAETLPHFRQSELAPDDKRASGFDPVTEADRAAERAMRAVLAPAPSRRRHPGRGMRRARRAPAG